jgi:cell filamentation protein
VGAIAERAGHPIDWERVDVDELRTARLHAVAGNDRPLADYLRAHLLSARDEGELAGRELGVFEREDLEIMRGAGVDVDSPSRGPEAAPSSRIEQWPSLPEQSRGIER